MKFRKKPVVIEAFRLGVDPMPDWFCDARTRNEVITHGVENDWRSLAYAEIHTREGVMRAEREDYVIKGVKGELYPCKSDIFEATYDAVAEPPLPQMIAQRAEQLRNELLETGK